jgi:hypothetical protein
MKQELHCHECDKYVQFDLDLSINGNHVLNCPNCGHEHCRVVEDGVITDDRWDSRNYTYIIPSNQIAWTTVSIDSTSTSSSYTLTGSWANASGGAGDGWI